MVRAALLWNMVDNAVYVVPCTHILIVTSCTIIVSMNELVCMHMPYFDTGEKDSPLLEKDFLDDAK